jgi:glycosyltransferase involved in cell wall biosynthesis
MISAVVPVFNEEESLRELHGELSAVAEQEGYDLEIVFVDDGSSDRSWEVVEALAAEDSRVRGVRFRANFGKAAALDAGFAAANGEIVFTLDADLQDDPKEMPRFIEKMAEGYDVVSGWKKKRYDPWHKVGPSRVFNAMVSKLTGVRLHDHNCGFKCYRGEIFEEVNLYGELHRFVPVLAAARGWKVSEIVVDHRARKFGHSKYGVRRIVKGFLDLLTVKFLTGFGQRPQHVLGTAGLGCFFLGGFGLTWLTIQWVMSRIGVVADALGLTTVHLTERALFYYCLGALILGAQFMTVGFLAELITAYQQSRHKVYSISKEVGGAPPPQS